MQDDAAGTGRSKVSYGNLFRNRHFVALWVGQTISFVGDYFYWLAIPIMVERLTGSALMVGLSIIFEALPSLLLGPVAGVFVDRWDRKRTMVVADVLRALLVLLCLLVRTAEQVWIFYVVAFLLSCVSRFFYPARTAALPLIVPDPDDLLAANGLMQAVETVGMVVGPALAGFSIGLWGEQVAFVSDSVSFLVSAVAILLITVPRTTVGQQAEGGRFAALWAELRDGVRYLFSNRTMVGVLVCLAVVQLGVGAITVIWVPYLQRTFGVGAEGLGLVDAAQGVGMIIGGAALGALVARLNKIALTGWGIAFIGLLLALMGLAPTFALVVVISFVIGLALVPVLSVLTTMMQLAVPDLKRGRVNSVLNALVTVATLLSMSAASGFGEAIGLRTVYVVCGLINVAAGVIGLFVLKEPPAMAE